MFYELRRYRILPGKMDEWIRLMEEEIIPFQVACGMVITGMFRGEEDDTVFVWMRRFESESEHWRNNIRPRIGEHMEREIEVTRIVPTPRSVTH